MQTIYADYAATTPCDPRVIAHMTTVLQDAWGNPSSLQSTFGRRAKAAVDQARASLAHLLSAHEDELTFTSGATEACNMALKGIATANPQQQIIVARSEHPAVLESAEAIAAAGIPVHWLDVDREGQVRVDDLAKALEKPTSAVALMLVNNQTGVVAAQESINKIIKAAGAYGSAI